MVSSTAQARIAIEISADTTTNSGRVRFGNWNQFNNAQVAIAPSALTVDEWHHVLGVQVVISTSSYGTRRVYLNGTVATAQVTANQAYTASFSDLRVGHRRTLTATTFTSFYDGEIAEVAVWSDVLTIDDAKALANGAKPTSVRPDLLTAYFPLVRSFSDSMEARAMTATNSPTISVHPRRFG
jgi:hypothetical protein